MLLVVSVLRWGPGPKLENSFDQPCETWVVSPGSAAAADPHGTDSMELIKLIELIKLSNLIRSLSN